MYWVYLILFIGMVVTPELTQGGFLFFNEEDFESLLIFCFGMLGLLLYLSKESAFIRTVREKLSLQQETNQIRKDLSESYSYIGEMNRRIDIVRNTIVSLPQAKTLLPERTENNSYEPIIEATRLLAQSDCVVLSFVAIGTGSILKRYEVGEGDHRETLQSFDGQHLLASKKYIWEEGKFTFVRSPESVEGVAAFIAFHKMKNQLEETGIFQILAALALFAFSVQRRESFETVS